MEDQKFYDVCAAIKKELYRQGIVEFCWHSPAELSITVDGTVDAHALATAVLAAVSVERKQSL